MKIEKFGSITMVGDDLNFHGFNFETEGIEFDSEQEMWRAMVITIARIMLEKAYDPFVHVAPPVAAGSVDTLQRFEMVESQYGTGYMVHWDKAMEEDADGEWVKHADVNAWAAQHVANAIKDQMERAEKAEAELKQVNEWRNAALQENMRLSDIWMDRVTRSEARVKELEAKLEFDCSPSRIDDLQYVLRCAGSVGLNNCDCHSCQPITMENNRMILCATCGNKRCPHANDHRNACTGSNEPGQAGSAYA